MELTRTAADRLQNGMLKVVHIFQDESIVRERNEMGIEPRVLQINKPYYLLVWGHLVVLHWVSD